MYDQLFYELLALSAAGFGLLGMGVVHLAMHRSAWWLRLGAKAVCAAGSIGLTATFAEPPPYACWTAVIVLGVWAIASVALWRGLHILSTRTLALLTQPLVCGLTAIVLGLGVLTTAMVKFERDDERALDAHMDFLELVGSKPPLHKATILVTTDRGNELTLNTPITPRVDGAISEAETQVMHDLKLSDQVIRIAAANDYANCHGWVFTGGQYWVDGDSVKTILEENGYTVVTDPQPGDLAIYTEGAVVTHTAIVRYTGAGQVPIVEGKWGWMGVFLHRVDQSCYGKQFTYYRSPRLGHLLVGVGGKPLSETVQQPKEPTIDVSE